MMKTVFYLACVLFVSIMISCNEAEAVPLPTLVPTAQVPEIFLTEQAAQAIETPSPLIETPISDRDSTVPGVESSFNGKGNIVYFNTIGEGLFFFNTDWAEPVQLYDLHNINRFLATSPDGGWLIFWNGGKLYSAKTDGSAINEIMGIDDISWVSWSPIGDRFAFIQDGNIFTMNADGGDLRRLTNDLELDDTANTLSWSPNGNRLLFTCNSKASDICLIASQGDEAAINLTNNTDPALYREPHWSPDGNLISFVSPDQENELQIFAMKTDGSDLAQLTEIGENSLHTWSPDGSRIAYATVVDGRWQANMMNSDGSSTLLLSEGLSPETNSIYPSWSPDGNLVSLFFTLPAIPDEFSIAVWNTEDSQLTTLTDRARWAEWSPDGAQIAFISPDSQIQIANSDGSGNVGLIECPEGCEFFTWLP